MPRHWLSINSHNIIIHNVAVAKAVFTYQKAWNAFYGLMIDRHFDIVDLPTVIDIKYQSFDGFNNKYII